jgi:hypothetical protein
MIRIFIILFVCILISGGISQIPKSAYIVNTEGEDFTKIDLENQVVIQPSKSLGLWSNFVKIQGDKAYVVISGIHEIRIFDLNSFNTAGRIQLPNGTNPWAIDFVNDSIAVVSLLFTNQISFINLESRQVLQTVVVGSGPEGVCYSNGKVYVANSGFNGSGYDPGIVSVVDVNDYSVTEINVGTNPQSIDRDLQGNIIVACTGDYGSIGAQVDIIDPQSHTVIHSQTVSQPITNVTVSRQNMAYLSTYGSGVMVYDLTQNIFMRDQSNMLAGGPSVDFDHNNNAYIVNFEKDSVYVYTPDFRIVERYLVGDGPISIAIYDPSPTNIATVPANIPAAFTLYQNYPNPFNPSTEIQYYLEKPARIQLGIYNVYGQLVNILVDDVVSAGTHRVNWDGRDQNDRQLPSGTFFYRLKVGTNETVRRMILLK